MSHLALLLYNPVRRMNAALRHLPTTDRTASFQLKDSKSILSQEMIGGSTDARVRLRLHCSICFSAFKIGKIA